EPRRGRQARCMTPRPDQCIFECIPRSGGGGNTAGGGRMRRGVVAMAVVWAVVLGAARVGLARGEHEIDDDQLEIEMARNRALAAYVARNGKPDVAESRELADRPPWDDHEVTLYYLGMRKEIGFARAWLLGRPTVHLERYERPLSDAEAEHAAARAEAAIDGMATAARTVPRSTVQTARRK